MAFRSILWRIPYNNHQNNDDNNSVLLHTVNVIEDNTKEQLSHISIQTYAFNFKQ